MDDWQTVGENDWQSVGGQAAPPMGQEIAGGVTAALQHAIANAKDYLNPFSEARHASYAQQAAAPLGQAIQQNLGQIAGTGSALATPITAPMQVAGAITTPPVAHGFQALNEAAGIPLPYEQAYQQAGTALMGMRPGKVGEVAAPAKSAQDLLDTGAAIYKRETATPVPKPDVQALTADLNKTLLDQGFRPTVGSAPGTMAEVARMQPGPNVSDVTVGDLRAARRALGVYAKQVGPDFRPTPDAAAANIAIPKIDDFLATISPDLATANANYSAGLAAKALDYRQMRAEHRAEKTGTGTNIENTLRQEVDKLSNRGLTPEEIALKDRIVRGDFPRNALRVIGRGGFDSGMSMLVHPVAAALTGGKTLAMPIAATLLRKGGEALTGRQVNQLNEMIRSRAPASLSQQPLPLTANPAFAGLPPAQFMQLLGLGQPMLPAYANQQN